MNPTPRELFQKLDELRKPLAVVVSADWFRHSLVYARAQMLMQPNLTPDMQFGALLYEKTLLGLTDQAPLPPEEPSPGLTHDMGDLRQRFPKTG